MSANNKKFLMAGVMGWPVMHTRSPRLHNHWINRYNLQGVYAPLAIEPSQLERALRALPALNFAGVNLTIPHKEKARRIVDRLDPTAEKIGAVNCVAVAADGSLTGYNFDAYGFIESVREAAPDWRAGAGPATIIGAGGGARAIIVGLLAAGAPEIRIVNRTFSRAEGLAAEFGLGVGASVTAHPWAERMEALEGAALLVNATSSGMSGQPPLDLPLASLPQDALVADIVYSPLETPLLAEARLRGNRGVNGLGMLIHQARPAFQEWFGVLPDVDADIRAKMAAPL